MLDPRSLLRAATAALLILSVAVVGLAQSYPPAWSKTATYAVGDEVQLNGNIVRAIKPVAVAGKYVYSSWELNFVRSNTTLLIGTGQTFTTLETAWAYAQNARIADGVFLHLYISSAHGNFEEGFSAPFSLDHAFGARISLIGDNQASVTLGGSSPFPHDGLSIDSGHCFGSISSLSVIGTSEGEGTGLKASYNSSISLTNVQIATFDTGICANTGASIHLDSNSVVGNSHFRTIQASSNGTITMDGGWSCSNSTGNDILYADTGGFINAESCTLNGVNQLVVGADAEHGGSIDLSFSTISNCTIGAYAQDHSYINGTEDSVSGNGTDFKAAGNGVVDIAGVNNPSTSVDSGTGSFID